MPVSITIEPINRDIELMLDESFSPEAQSAMLAEFADTQIEEAKQVDAVVLGYVPRVTVSVDGVVGAPLKSVKPDGVVVAEFELVGEALRWIYQQLRTHSPVSHGRDPDPNIEYLDSHKLFADGVEVDVAGVIPSAREFVFVNTTPYAHKIELGASSQAPDGVYQAVAVLAGAKFPDFEIRFDYRAIGSSAHMPAVVVTLGGR